MALILVLLMRLGAPLAIFIHPFWGGLAAIASDFFDLHIFEALNWSGIPATHYQAFDKVLDMYYLTFELWLSLKWADATLRRISVSLFVWRAIGFIAFEATGLEWILLAAPNIFEYFFLFVVARELWFPAMRLDTVPAILILLLSIAIPKLANEYILHVKKTSTLAFIRETFRPPAEAARSH